MTDHSRTPTTAASRPLVVIDMQSGFYPSLWTLKPVLAEIEAAMANNDAVVIVRYPIPYAGEIAPAILAMVQGYEHAIHVDKLQENGANEVLAACLDAQLSLANLRLCGVTTDDCVTKTAHGLAALLPDSRIEVVQAACSCSISNYDWTQFSQASNVFVV